MATRRKVIRVANDKKSNATLLVDSKTVQQEMTGNLNYPTPNPTLLVFGTMVTDFEDAIVAWGEEGNRGPHSAHLDLIAKRIILEDGITNLADYCMNTTPYDEIAFASGGWNVKNESNPVGLVGPVRFLHQYVKGIVPSGAVKLRWTFPEGAPRGSVKSYKVLVSLTADINTATIIGLTTKSTFTDLEAGNRPSNFYWVIPVCTAGSGGIAEVVQGYPMGPVIA